MPVNSAYDYEASQIGQRRIWLPSECWVDTLRLLSRRQLLRGIQPACKRLHAIAELHVPNLHIVRNLGRFLIGLENNLPEANRHYAELKGSKADLARHFLLGGCVDLQVIRGRLNQSPAGYKVQRCVLRHSLELFRSYQLRLWLYPASSPANPDELLAYLSLLTPTRPLSIEIVFFTKPPEPRADLLLREPIVLACPG